MATTSLHPTGVACEIGANSRFDKEPIFMGINNYPDPAWAQYDANDNPVTGSIFPVVGGSQGSGATRMREGQMAPDNFVTGNLGDIYRWSPTTTTCDMYLKVSQSLAGVPDSTGWVLK